MNEVNQPQKIRIYLKQLWQECEEGCKSIFKEMEDISKETEISQVRYKLEYIMYSYQI